MLLLSLDVKTDSVRASVCQVPATHLVRLTQTYTEVRLSWCARITHTASIVVLLVPVYSEPSGILFYLRPPRRVLTGRHLLAVAAP